LRNDRMTLVPDLTRTLRPLPMMAIGR
jgi:hypothetical protein